MCVIIIHAKKKYACAQLYFSVVLFHNVTVRAWLDTCVFYYIMMSAFQTCFFSDLVTLLSVFNRIKVLDVNWRWEKTQEGGLNCVGFFFFFSYSSDVQLLKWCSDTKLQQIKTEREREREREREKRHKAIIQVPSTNRK